MMIQPTRPEDPRDSSPPGEGDPSLEDLIEECTNRLQAGEELDLDDLAAGHPEHADRLRRLLPSLRMMAEIGGTVAGAVPAVIPGNGPFELGDYCVLRTIGRGGMGIVYEAVQLSLNRRVALKVLPFAAALDPHQLRRFQIEAQAAAQLHHTSIVPVFSVGCERGVHFYAMQYIEGRTLAALIHDRREASRPDAGPTRPSADREYVRSVGRLGIQAAEALDHAHRQGIIHRDIKPANLLVDDRERLWITDFGLARFVNEAGLTVTGDLIGTLRYMSPEQALAKRLVLDHRTDIYSLGATLYELLTLRPVVDGRDRQEVLRRIAQDEPLPPRRVDPTIARDLETILLKTLAREPEERYATAQELADDLRRFLEHRPIRARRPSFMERAAKWTLRHRSTVAATVIILGMSVVGLGAVAGIQARANGRLSAAVAQAEESREQAELITGFLAEALRSPDPAHDGREIKVVDILDRASGRLDDEFLGSDASRGALLEAIGDTYFGLGLYEKAGRLHAEALAVREAALGPVHRDTLTSRDHLGNDAWCAGRYAEAVALHEVTLRRRMAALGPDHPDTLTSRHNLAVAYRNASRPDLAIALQEENVRRRAAVLGADHADTLLSRNNLANSYKDAGRLADAIALYESTLERREKALGPEHLDTLQSRNNLAVAYRDAGRYDRSIALHLSTLRSREARLGRDHPHTLFCRHDLGVAYCHAGRYPEAIAVLEEAIRLRGARLGIHHAETIHSRGCLAEAYRGAGRLAESLSLAVETFRLGEEWLGVDHHDTLQSGAAMVSAYESLGRWAEAERHLRDLAARRRRAASPDHPLLAGDLNALGRSLLMQSRWAEAESPLRESLAIYDKAMPDGWRRYLAMNQLGGSLLGQGHRVEAEGLIVRGYEGMESRRARIPAPEGSRLREAADRVVRLYESWGRADRAAAWRDRLRPPWAPEGGQAP